MASVHTFGLKDFFSNLSSSVVMDHFYYYFVHWEFAALVLTCKEISETVLHLASSQLSSSSSSSSSSWKCSSFSLWRHLSLLRSIHLSLKHNTSPNITNNIEHLTGVKDHNYRSYGQHYFLSNPWLRGDGVYVHRQAGFTNNRIFRFNEHDHTVI